MIFKNFNRAESTRMLSFFISIFFNGNDRFIEISWPLYLYFFVLQMDIAGSSALLFSIIEVSYESFVQYLCIKVAMLSVRVLRCICG